MKEKPLTTFDSTQQWCDYELLSTVAELLKQDGRLVRIPSYMTRTISTMTITDDYISLQDLAKLMLHIADHLENTENYL